MEDFEGAHFQRGLDTAALDNAGRRVGAMHLGGMTIECLLKHMIVRYHGIVEWNMPSVVDGVPIRRPGHDVGRATEQIARLHERILRSPDVRAWLEEIHFPGNLLDPATGGKVAFWNARYDSRTPTDAAYEIWRTAYTELRKWLLDQMRTL